jgi:hypothetical protein
LKKDVGTELIPEVPIFSCQKEEEQAKEMVKEQLFRQKMKS